MTQTNTFDQTKCKTLIPPQSLIKDKLEEIYIIFGMIFHEEQFFIKFKNNIFQLNTLIQDNSLPNFRIIHVLMEEFDKIMKSQEKEMLFAITAFYYFLYKNFISLFDELNIGNKQVNQKPNVYNNTQQFPTNYNNLGYSFPIIHNPFVINNCFNKTSIPSKKQSVTTSNNDHIQSIEGKRLTENTSPNKQNPAEDNTMEEKYSFLGKKQKTSELVIEIKEKEEVKINKNQVSADKPLPNKEDRVLVESWIKDNESFAKVEVNKDKESLSLNQTNNETIQVNWGSKSEKVNKAKEKEDESKVTNENNDVNLNKEDSINQDILKKKITNKENNINSINKSHHSQNNLILSTCKEKELNIPDKTESKGKATVESQKEEILTKPDKLTSERESQEKCINIINDKYLFDQKYDQLINSSVEISDYTTINHLDTKYILEQYPNIDNEHMKIFKTGEITNKTEMEMMKKIIRQDYKREYENCFKYKKPQMTEYYFITKIANSEGKEYLMKFDKEAFEFSIFEYINNIKK